MEGPHREKPGLERKPGPRTVQADNPGIQEDSLFSPHPLRGGQCPNLMYGDFTKEV